MIQAYLFDLDMTLVDTNALAMLRRAHLWSEVKKNLHLVRPFPATGKYAPHKIPALLRNNGSRVGIVTSSPRWYAETLLTQFGISYDVLVTYEDTQAHKPDPSPLLEALHQLKVNPSPNVVYVGDDVIDFEASYRAGITSVGVRWAPTSIFELSSAAPDVLIEKPSLLLNTERVLNLGYAGECLSKGMSYVVHAGSTLECDANPPVRTLGRYFTTSDPRHAASPLCTSILTLKQNDEPASRLGDALGRVLGRWEWIPDYIVPVPPKPSQTRQRFERLLKETTTSLSKKSKVLLDGLRCVREIDGYKGMKPLERQVAVKGAFASEYNWNNNNVLLIDDVYTTGETIKECARVVKRSGAAEVRCAVLGKDQRTFQRKDCPECGRPMRVRRNSQTGDRFWGCSGFPDACKHTERV